MPIKSVLVESLGRSSHGGRRSRPSRRDQPTFYPTDPAIEQASTKKTTGCALLPRPQVVSSASLVTGAEGRRTLLQVVHSRQALFLFQVSLFQVSNQTSQKMSALRRVQSLPACVLDATHAHVFGAAGVDPVRRCLEDGLDRLHLAGHGGVVKVVPSLHAAESDHSLWY